MKQKISDINRRVLTLVNCLILLFTIILFIFKHNVLSLLYPICIAFFVLITAFCIFFFGYKKDKKSREKSRINNMYIVFSIFYLITVYLVGFFTGFKSIIFSLENAIYLVFLAIVIEILRYVLITKSSKSSNESVVLTFILVIFDVLILSEFGPRNFPNIVTILYFLVVAFIKNSMLSYTVGNFSYKSSILYSLVASILPMIAPKYPDLGGYLTIVLLVVYTLTLFYNVSKPSRRDDEETESEYKRGPLFYIERLALVFIVLIIFFVSGVFKFSISAIASDSMYPEIKKGDAVILEKADEENLKTLQKGMIIAYKEGDQVITHRILTIEEIEGKTYITTKGDNNSSKDVTKKTKDDIIGIVRFKIPYVGYPSVEISEIMNRNKN